MDFMKKYESSGVGNPKEYKVPKKTLSMIKGLYEEFKCHVIHKGKLTNSSQVTTGDRVAIHYKNHKVQQKDTNSTGTLRVQEREVHQEQPGKEQKNGNCSRLEKDGRGQKD